MPTILNTIITLRLGKEHLHGISVYGIIEAANCRMRKKKTCLWCIRCTFLRTYNSCAILFFFLIYVCFDIVTEMVNCVATISMQLRSTRWWITAKQLRNVLSYDVCDFLRPYHSTLLKWYEENNWIPIFNNAQIANYVKYFVKK